MRQRSARLLIQLLIITVISSISAQEFRKYAGEFMSIDVSARAQAMGGAFSSVSDDVFAAFYNPAGLAQITSTQLGFTHTQQFLASVNYDYLGFVHSPNEDRSYGVSLIRLGIDNIKDSRAAGILDEQGVLLGIDESQLDKFNSADYVFFFSLGQRLGSKFMLGFNAKLVRRDLADHTANGLGFDAGAMYAVSDSWQVSVMARNVTSTLIAWDTGEKELVTPNLRFGTSYLVNLPGLRSYFRPNFDFIVQAENTPNLTENAFGNNLVSGALGGEFVVNERLFLRGGYDELQRVNFGVGFSIPHVRLDYAFTQFDDELDNAHRIGILIDFAR